jgi:hypothetical protein
MVEDLAHEGLGVRSLLQEDRLALRGSTVNRSKLMVDSAGIARASSRAPCRSLAVSTRTLRSRHNDELTARRAASHLHEGPDARLSSYPDSAHSLLLQHHARFAAHVHGFLDESG